MFLSHELYAHIMLVCNMSKPCMAAFIEALLSRQSLERLIQVCYKKINLLLII